MLEKLKSRKLWITVGGVVVGAATALSNQGGKVGTVAGIIVAGATAITYIITEGRIDKAGVQLTVDTIEQITEMLEKEGK